MAGTLVAVRFLSPADFGIIAIAYLVGEFIDVFRDFGLTSALVQRKTVTAELRSSVFWSAQILTFGLVALLYLAAPLVATFYGSPIVGKVLRVCSLCFIFNGLASVHLSILQREMQFHKIAVIEIASSICGNTVLIVAAVNGAGPWSIVAGWITNIGVAAISNIATVRWVPRLELHEREIRSVLGYSLNLSGSRTVEFFSRNVDNAIVGRFLGLPALGFYQFSYNLMLYSGQSISVMTSRVLFSALSKVQDDHVRFRAAYTKSASMVALIMFPLMLGAMVVADPFVRAVCGAKWIPAIPLVRILALVGMLQSLTAMVANIYSATGRTERLFRWGVVTAVVYVIAFFVGVRWGTAGVATAYLTANALLFFPTLALAFQLIGLKLGDFVRPLLPVLAIAGVMSLCVAGLRLVMPAWPPLAQLGVLAIAGIAIYAGLMLLILPAPARHLLEFAHQHGWSGALPGFLKNKVV
jgi:PST family polysaccharide transporter